MPIANDGVKYPLGRCTRVWKVVRLTDGKVNKSARGKVLKDSWVDEDREREGEILDRIKNQPEVEEDEDMKPAFDGLPLTAVASGDPSHTVRRADSVAESRISIVPTSVHLQQELSISRLEKRHYHILFAEECKPLLEETSLRTVFRALTEITDSLSLLHLTGCGWVHRDISCGNIMYHRESDAWKLSDVEFAKRLDVESAHEIQTGTANFMAVEVDKGNYLFGSTPSEPRALKGEHESVKAIARRMNQRRREGSPAPGGDERHMDTSVKLTKEKPFYYNPTHDLESLWWISVYFVINKGTSLAVTSDDMQATDKEYSGSPNCRGSMSLKEELPSCGEERELVDSTDSILSPTETSLTIGQRLYARKLFYNYLDRFLAMIIDESNEFDRKISKWPAHLRKICTGLIRLRRSLREHYIAIEQPEFVITNKVCNVTKLYKQFRESFAFVKKLLSEGDITVAPLPFDP
ncbi:hypothetical protein BDY19DRAFT_1044128 [Irpex rosettiformis]|uniref:Uncharacterized protein n=1 Tax=Irpex rosettiformis TaxID=378272 RepID=A0ACB8UID1_9APHY|nr:hypothetical protein BDY19DRAFT_1044128 [Irpex rosettiformis]